MTASPSTLSRLPGTVTKRLMFLAGGTPTGLARQIADTLGVSIAPQTAHTFANGESFVRFDTSVRGSDTFVLHTATTPLNTALMEQLIMIDALKRASAKRITVIWPFYPYARQDKKHQGREPVSARLVADLLATAGADRIVAVDLHTPQAQGFFDRPVDHLLAQPLLAGYLRERYRDTTITVVAPDSGRVKLAETWAELLGGQPIAFVQHRKSLHTHHADAASLIGEVTGRLCVVVDDMIDTGATMVGAARVLLAAGATDVVAAATHAVLSDGAAGRLSHSGIREVVLTDTLPLTEDKRFPQLTVRSVAPLIASAIEAIFTDGSVTSLFDC
ncbi:ribose-phosphate diphosphokinase [Amycolatopsis sp. NPDC059657]|uniref:ribose-phosphate diphosphokinase n=1 Tax=Amycolatopsis sp. NPDC059657 TaxID=3346899 RepID=UPI00366DA2FF